MLRASATAEFSAFAEAVDHTQLGFGRDRGLPGGGLLLCRAMVNQALRNIRVCCTKTVEYWNNVPVSVGCQRLPGAVMPRKIEKQVALDRALTVFWDHGYRGTSMDMLTERLGVEKPSIYASFGSKHKLYLSALGHYREWLIGSVRHIVSAAPSARAGVDQAVRMMMLRRSAKSRKGCFATNATLEVADHDPLVRQEVRRTFAELAEVFSHALKRAQSAGHVRTDCAPEILAQLLVNAIGGARIMEKTKASNSATEAVVALIIGILDAPALGAERTTLS